jgi:hypothetical protein
VLYLPFTKSTLRFLLAEESMMKYRIIKITIKEM